MSLKRSRRSTGLAAADASSSASYAGAIAAPAKRSPRLEEAAQLIADLLGGSEAAASAPPPSAVLSALAPLFEPSAAARERALAGAALAELREYSTEVSRLGAVAGSQWYWQAPPGERRCRYMAFCRHLQGVDGCLFWHTAGEVDLIAATRVFEERKAEFEALFGPLEADDFNCGGSSVAPPSSAPPLRLFRGAGSSASASAASVSSFVSRELDGALIGGKLRPSMRDWGAGSGGSVSGASADSGDCNSSVTSSSVAGGGGRARAWPQQRSGK